MNKLTEEINQICAWINDICSGFKGCVLGLSGGLDSAVVAALCTRANVKTHALIMPARKDAELKDAILCAEQFGLIYEILDISQVVNSAYELSENYTHKPQQQTTEQNHINNGDFGVAQQNHNGKTTPQNREQKAQMLRFGNLCARTRMMMLYDYSAAHNLLVAGTSNLSERMLGYFTVFGDGACAFNPIAEFYKSEVFALAKELKIHQNIIDKAPSADFYQDQSDEKDLGFSYLQIDAVLKALKNGEQIDEKYAPLLARVRQNAFKLREISTFKRTFDEKI